jgi:tRNA(Arg) A34 adenosine deaminase TadA
MTGAENAEQAARLALDEAKRARRQGTFGVGAVLVEDRTGSVLDTASNDVVRRTRSAGTAVAAEASTKGRPEHLTHDPTAHGERQLITRYFERTARGEHLPPPEDLTIVSSLEPCALCSGAILASGFKVGVIALDPIAGLGAMGSERFKHLPVAIRRGADASFGYYEVPGVRSFVGATSVAFGGSDEARVVSREAHDACEKTFLESSGRAMAVVSEGAQTTPGKDPSNLDPEDPLRSFLAERLPHFLEFRLENPRIPDRRLLELLDTLSRNEPGRGSAAALVDRFGNLLLASGGGPTVDPTATGFVDVFRTYSQTRFHLTTDPTVPGPAPEYLAHPKFGTLYRYPVPQPDSPVTLLELGAYGSTMEGPLPSGTGPNLQFIGEGVAEEGSREKLLALVGGMPPFYSETIGLDFDVTSF